MKDHREVFTFFTCFCKMALRYQRPPGHFSWANTLLLQKSTTATTSTLSPAFSLWHIAFCSIWYFRLGVKYIKVHWRIICGFWSSRMFLCIPGFNSYFRAAWAHGGPMQPSILLFHQQRHSAHNWENYPRKSLQWFSLLTDLQSFTRDTQKSLLSGRNILL